MGSEEEKALLRKMAEGDSEAAELLQGKYNPRLLPIIKGRLASFPAATRQRFDADDVLQETWTNVIARADEYQSKYLFFLWLRRICIDQLLTGYREHVTAAKRDVRKEAANHRFSADTSGLLVDQLISSLTSASSLLRRGELKEKLTEKIESMEEKDREVVILRHFEELTNQEVAELLGLTPQAASLRYTRALARLGEIAADLDEFLD